MIISSNSYIYTGGDGERLPQDARNVGYAAGLTSIKANAARNNRSITSVVHPNSIIVIEDGAYAECSSIDNLRLSSSLQTIGVETFYECYSITRLELPPTLHTIKRKGFDHCFSLQVIAPQQQHETLSLQTIEEEAFVSCIRLTTIPNMPFLVTIGPRAFSGCCKLTVIPHLPSLVTIGPKTFCKCTSLTEVTLGPSVTSAARNSFENCKRLKSLKCTYRTHTILPWAVTHVTVDIGTSHIHTSAFAGCNKLHIIAVPPSVISLGPSCFWGCKKLPSDFTVSNMVKQVGIGAFARCEINSVNLPAYAMQDIYTFIGGEGEKIPRGVEKVVIHETVRVIKKDSFEKCDRMTHLKINSKSITIQKRAMSYKDIQEIEFHAETTFNIEQNAFYMCSRLELSKVKWPKSVKRIVDGNFDENPYLLDLQPIPIMHKNAFTCKQNARKGQHELTQYCQKYHLLSKYWKWIISRKLEREKMQTTKRIYPNSFQNRKCECLCHEDMNILRRVRRMVPLPRNLVNAIINDLHSFDIAFGQLPKDLVWKVIEFIF